MICAYTIALQKRLEDAAHLLRNSGHRAEADLMHEASRVIYRQAESMTTIARLAKGDFPMESDR